MGDRILVVDDEPKVRELLGIVLKKNSYEILTASNGKEALSVLRKEKVDLVLADIMMPEMDGYELCKRIREDPKLYPLRFIFVTAKTEREDELEGFKLGADDYITKPFNIKTLLARIETRLREMKEAKEEITESGELKGSISQGNLFNILQILGMGKKSGILTVKSKTGQGGITLWDGQVVDAKVEERKMTEAVYEILNWEEGNFCFKPSYVEFEGNMVLPIPHLLLEWARIRDETSKDLEIPIETSPSQDLEKRKRVLTYKKWLDHLYTKE